MLHRDAVKITVKKDPTFYEPFHIPLDQWLAPLEQSNPAPQPTQHFLRIT